MSSWKVYKLGDIAKNASRRFDFSKHSNVIFINTGDVLNNQFLHKDYSIAEGLPGQAKKAIQKGDILYSEIRPGNGRYLLVGNGVDDYVVSTKFMVIESNREVILPEFLFLLLISNEATEYFKVIAESRSGTFPQITFDSISHYELRIPSKDIQQSIVDNIFALDQKIQLNTQINQTLEQIAQTIFKSWFIDFDPVHAKAEALANGQTAEQATQAAMAVISGKNTQELHRLQTANPEQYQQLWEIAEAFPSGVDEVGVPWGWSIKYFKDITSLYIDNRGKTPPIEESGIPLLEVKHLPEHSIFPNLKTEKYISDDIYDSWLRQKLEPLDIVISTVGTIGRISLIPFNKKVAIAQNILGFRFKQNVTNQVFMFYQMKSHKFNFDVEARLVETVQKSIKRKDLETIPLIIPDLKLQKFFEKMVLPTILKQDNENETLEKIRDELLLKLLSGEILNGN